MFSGIDMFCFFFDDALLMVVGCFYDVCMWRVLGRHFMGLKS